MNGAGIAGFLMPLAPRGGLSLADPQGTGPARYRIWTYCM